MHYFDEKRFFVWQIFTWRCFVVGPPSPWIDWAIDSSIDSSIDSLIDSSIDSLIDSLIGSLIDSSVGSLIGYDFDWSIDWDYVETDSDPEKKTMSNYLWEFSSIYLTPLPPLKNLFHVKKRYSSFLSFCFFTRSTFLA